MAHAGRQGEPDGGLESISDDRTSNDSCTKTQPTNPREQIFISSHTNAVVDAHLSKLHVTSMRNGPLQSCGGPLLHLCMELAAVKKAPPFGIRKIRRPRP